MIKLFIGGASSGKSEAAERMIIKDQGWEENSRLFYLATMTARDPESKKRIERHRDRRQGFGFQTLEMGRNISDARQFVSSADFILLEDIPNLVANELFKVESNDKSAVSHLQTCEWLTKKETSSNGVSTLYEDSENRIVNHIANELIKLDSACFEVIAVTGELFSDGNRYDPETDRYLRILAGVNYEIALRSEFVYEIVCGAENILKG